jgi:hypothetical protein
VFPAILPLTKGRQARASVRETHAGATRRLFMISPPRRVGDFPPILGMVSTHCRRSGTRGWILQAHLVLSRCPVPTSVRACNTAFTPRKFREVLAPRGCVLCLAAARAAPIPSCNRVTPTPMVCLKRSVIQARRPTWH